MRKFKDVFKRTIFLFIGIIAVLLHLYGLIDEGSTLFIFGIVFGLHWITTGVFYTKNKKTRFMYILSGIVFILAVSTHLLGL